MNSLLRYKKKASSALFFLSALLLAGAVPAYAHSGGITKIMSVNINRSGRTIDVNTIGSPRYKKYLFKRGRKSFFILVFKHSILYGHGKKIARPFKDVLSVAYSQFSVTPKYTVHVVIGQNVSARLQARVTNLGHNRYKVIIRTNAAPSKVKRPKINFKVFIDAGHGGSDPGGIGHLGLPESFVNLSIALKLRKILSGKGIKTVIDRTSNINISLRQRVAEANNSGANLFIGLYCNSAVVPGLYGTTVYYFHGSSYKFADYLEHYISSHLNLKYDGVVHDDLYVLRFTTMPSVIIEYAYISNPYEEHLLASSTFRHLIAVEIANAIYKHFITKKG